MSEYGYQTGGSERHWLFNPQDVDTLGPILSKLAVHDKYFSEEQGQTTLAIVLDRILEELPPELEEAVRLVHLAGVSHRSAARTVGVDHKTIKARADRGVARLRARLKDTVWLAAILSGMLPDEPEQAAKASSPDKVYTVLNGLSKARNNE
jgi:DNA-directed RNA polymerase specialized sigma24 family protein